jgi:hypothetical protein
MAVLDWGSPGSPFGSRAKIAGYFPSVEMGALRAPIGIKISVVSGDEVAVTVE